MTSQNQKRYLEKKEPKMVAYCIECEAKVHDTGIPETKVCLNPNCKNYQVIVTNWYNFEVN